MSFSPTERYTLRRLQAIALIVAVAAAVAWLLGYPRAAWGAIGSAPVAMINYLMVYRAVHQAERKQAKGLRGIMLASLARLVISIATLWAASRFGVEVMFGALAALVSEMLSYTQDTVRAMITLKRG